MSIESSPEVSCETCVAACCRAGGGMILSTNEASRHRQKMKLRALVKPKNYPQQTPPQKIERQDEEGNRRPETVSLRVPAHHGFYILLTDCGNLTEDFRCAVYDERPGACEAYELGSEDCIAARALYGLDGHEGTISQEIRTEPIKIRIPRIPLN